MKRRWYWIGLCDGKPLVEVDELDPYGPRLRVVLFTSRRSAAKEYQDVRRVEIMIEPRGRDER